MELLTDHERAMADDGIERIEAAIMRSVENGVSLNEATDLHVNAIFEEFPHAALVMSLRMAELTVQRGVQA